MYKSFYKQTTKKVDPTYIAPVAKPDEGLTGMVQGKTAAQDEERFARALDRNSQVMGYEFRLAVGAPKGMPGWRELDFLVETYSGYRAFEIDDTSFVHKGESARATDRLHDISRVQALQNMGAEVAHGVEHVDAVAHLQNQNDANRKVRELIQ